MESDNFGSIRGRLRGLVPPLCTIRRADGSLWPDMQCRLLDLVAPHVDAIFVSGTTGLCPWLSLDKQKTLIEMALSYVDEQGLDTPVICAALGNTATEVAERSQSLRDAGAAAVVVYTPYFFRHTDEELVRFFTDLAGQAEDVPFVLYNLPQMTQNNISPDIVRQVVDACGNYVAVKDSKGDAEQFRNLLPLRHRLNVLNGDEEISRDVLSEADGCVPAAANVFPLLWREVLESAKDRSDWERHHPLIMKVKREVYGLPDMPQVITGILTALEMLGIGAGPTPPFLPFDKIAPGRGMKASVANVLRELREYIPEPFRAQALS